MTDHAILVWNPSTEQHDDFLGDDEALRALPSFVIKKTATGARWLVRSFPHHSRWQLHMLVTRDGEEMAHLPGDLYVELDEESGSFVGRERTGSLNPDEREPLVQKATFLEAVVRTAFWPI